MIFIGRNFLCGGKNKYGGENGTKDEGGGRVKIGSWNIRDRKRLGVLDIYGILDN